MFAKGRQDDDFPPSLVQFDTPALAGGQEFAPIADHVPQPRQQWTYSIVHEQLCSDLFLGLANVAKAPCCESHCDCLSGSFLFLFFFNLLLARLLFLEQHWRMSDMLSTITSWLFYSLCFGETVPSFPLPLIWVWTPFFLRTRR
jgi:hypothetical protein